LSEKYDIIIREILKEYIMKTSFEIIGGIVLTALFSFLLAYSFIMGAPL